MTEPSTPASGSPGPAYVVVLGLRVGWLNALIIGATIFVWLSLIGSVLLGVAFALEWESTNDPVIEFPFDNTSCPAGKVLDARGFCVDG
jgi:hypothetical protein